MKLKIFSKTKLTERKLNHFLKKFVFSLLLVLSTVTILEGKAQTHMIVDIAGREVKIKKNIKRVILGEGRQMYIIAALEGKKAFDKIVGWKDDLINYDPDAYEKYLAKFPSIKNLPNFGSPYKSDFSVEKAIALNADVVIMNLGNLHNAKESGIIRKLSKVGIKVVFIDFRERPTQNTVPTIILLGKILNREEKAYELVSFYLMQMRKVTSIVNNIKQQERPLVFIESAAGYGKDCCNTFGSSNLGRLIEEAGGINLGSTFFSGFKVKLNVEIIFKKDPDIIIGTGANWLKANPQTTAVLLGYKANNNQNQKRLKALASRGGWSELKAVKEKRFYSIYHQFYNSPYHFVAIQQFAKWIYPKRFKSLDPKKTFIDFHKKFLPISYSGQFWLELK